MSKKTKADPTGQSTNRNRAAKKVQNRLLKAKSKIKKLFRAVPRTKSQQSIISNASITVFDYDLTPYQLEALEREIRSVIRDELLETPGERMPLNWYGKDLMELPYRQGSAEEVVEFNQLVNAAIVAGLLTRSVNRSVDIGQFLRSNDYLDRLQRTYNHYFNTIRALSDRTSTQVVREVVDGMNSGRRPSDIIAAIDERFDVADSSAVRDANTEVNAAYNNARMEATESLASDTGLRAVVLHISALLPTTRETHAARHGNAYTVVQQNQWWDQGANRINCHCTTRAVLVDSSGNLLDPITQEEIQAERSFFDE